MRIRFNFEDMKLPQPVEVVAEVTSVTWLSAQTISLVTSKEVLLHPRNDLTIDNFILDLGTSASVAMERIAETPEGSTCDLTLLQ